jgi:hypothetical protein
MHSKEIECKGVDWFYLAEDRFRWPVLLDAVMHLRVSQNAGNFFTT